MMKMKNLYENFDLARFALENWEHDKDSLDDMLARFRISSNAIYPFLSGGSLMFLRMAPTDEKEEVNLLGELEFVGYLGENGFPALRPVKSKDGRLLIKLDTEWGGYFASVFAAVDSEAVDDTDYSAEIMYSFGRTLGRLHALSAVFCPQTKKQSHEDILERISDIFTALNVPVSAWRELEEVKSQLARLTKTSANYGLVHYDFEPDNVFYSGNEFCSVIDFDDGIYHWYALDIVQALDSLGDELGDDPIKLGTAKSELLRGYKAEYEFTEETERLLPLMRRFVNLYGYARIIRCTAEILPDEPDWVGELREKLAGAAQAKERSCAAEI